MANQTTIVNGVDTKALFGTIDAVKEKADVAKFHFKVNNKWYTGGHNRSVVHKYYGACDTQQHEKAFELDADEPPLLLGEDKGANPVEYLLHALAACVTTSMVYHAAAKGIIIDEIESKVEGDIDLQGFLGLDKTVPNGYKQIKMTFKIKADVSREELEALCQLGPTFSPVYYTITHAVPVTVELAAD